MRRLFWLAWLLTGCVAVGAPPTAVTATPTATPSPPPTATATATATVTLTPPPPTATPSPSPTATPPWEPWGSLQRPIPAAANPFPALGYLYGGTAEGTREPHHGVEFENPPGTPVLAAAAGEVVFAGADEEARYSPWPNFYGNLVVLRHQAGERTFYTLYAHLSAIAVHEGQRVAAGQEIGAVGMTGAAVGPHLHFEVRLDGASYTDTRNPVLWLAPADPSRRGAVRGRVARADGQPVHTFLTLQQLDAEGRLLRQYQLETYAPEKYPVPTEAENFALGDLPPGRYRLSLVYGGRLWEQFFTLAADQVAEVNFTLP